MEAKKIELYTKSAYAKKLGVSVQAVHQMVKKNKVKTLEIYGATLIKLEK